ncbi:apoptosis regulator BAX-like [Megalops cyprinoides]|uniref:apoptosis regulator BAX-like n=1 Tax=Megalops cyprinoides TaxID=118141 RepID=UPI001863A12A|nr:apoptosis regulator BAX-like [Megalops cyprinoides]
MARNVTSEDRDEIILHRSEVLLKDFIQDQLNEEAVGSEVVLIDEPLTQEEEESRIMKEISLLVRRTAETLQRDTELNHAINSKWPLTNKDNYWKLVNKVFEDGVISWERIVVLFYIAGKIAVKCVSAHIPQSVSDIISWTLDFFRRNLVDWIREQGGWESIFSCLSTPTSQLIAVFLSGILLGAFIVWKMTKRN